MEAPIYKLCRYHLLALICLGNILAYMTRFSTTVTMLAMDDLNLTSSQKRAGTIFLRNILRLRTRDIAYIWIK